MRIACAVILLVACSEPAPPAPASGGAPPPSRPPAAPVAAPVPTQAPAPAPTPAVDPTYACTTVAECELVGQGCDGVEAVNRSFADQKRADRARQLSVGECREVRPTDAVSLACENGRCRTYPLRHPELRRCARDRDCTTIDSHCHWYAVSRRDPEANRAAFPVGSGCPSIMPMPPEARCTFGFCAHGEREP